MRARYSNQDVPSPRQRTLAHQGEIPYHLHRQKSISVEMLLYLFHFPEYEYAIESYQFHQQHHPDRRLCFVPVLGHTEHFEHLKDNNHIEKILKQQL